MDLGELIGWGAAGLAILQLCFCSAVMSYSIATRKLVHRLDNALVNFMTVVDLYIELEKKKDAK